MLVPLGEDLEVPGSFELLRNLTYPNGYLSLVHITSNWLEGETNYEFDHLAGRFRNSGVFTRTSVIDGSEYFEGIMNSLVLSGGFFGPNILFLDLSKNAPPTRRPAKSCAKRGTPRWASTCSFRVGTGRAAGAV